MRPATQGLGAILMFHHVPPGVPGPSIRTGAWNRALLPRCPVVGTAGAGLGHRSDGCCAGRLRAPTGGPFAALTFDDGYRDNAEHALPILKRHGAPFTIHVTTGFADGDAALWWLDLEESAGREREPGKVYAALYRELRGRPDLIARIAAMTDAAASRERTRSLCLDWEALAALAAEPLCTIGAHTLTHPILGTLDAAAAGAEIARSKALIEERLKRPVRHFAYPVGDRAAAGPREFAFARAAGFDTAVTTRPGMLFADHAAHLHALPRLSVNGWHQSLPACAPFSRARPSRC